MGEHIMDGEFQSDKYPTTPRGKVPLSTKDPLAQDLLWEYAQRRRAVDAEFSADLKTALIAKDFNPTKDALLANRAVVAKVEELVASVAHLFEDAPGGPYQMEAVDDIPPELKEKIGRAVAAEVTQQTACGVMDYFKIWRAGLVPCRERLNQKAAMPEEIINICEHGVVTSDGSCPQCDNGSDNGTFNGR